MLIIIKIDILDTTMIITAFGALCEYDSLETRGNNLSYLTTVTGTSLWFYEHPLSDFDLIYIFLKPP